MVALEDAILLSGTILSSIICLYGGYNLYNYSKAKSMVQFLKKSPIYDGN